MEGIEKNLTELEKMSQQTEARIHALSPHYGVNHCLLVVNEVAKLDDALAWLKSHQINLNSVLFIQKFDELTAPVVLKPTEDVIIPPFLASTVSSLSGSGTDSLVIYAVPPLEMTTTAVNLLHSGIDLVLIVGCHCLSRKEYEDVTNFKPFIEEIILKEAIQPVVLFK